MSAYREWICFEHRPGDAQQRAHAWWKICDGRVPAPKTIADALARKGELTLPTHIAVKREGKFWRVAGRRFTHENGALEYDEKGRCKIVTDIEEAA